METKLTAKLLYSNGWELKGGVYVKRDKVRLGWYEKDGTTIVGYYIFPIKIETVEKMQQLQSLLGNEILQTK